MTPITGNSYVAVGYTTQLLNATVGGSWSSSNTAIATVGASSGLVTSVSIGSAVITYTGLDTSTATFTINSVASQVSNGFNVARVYNATVGRIGWQQPSRVGLPTIDNQNLSSKSGRYFMEGHELVSINNIYKSQENENISDADFNEYLRQQDRSSIIRCINAIFPMTPFVEHRLCYLRRAYQQNVLIPKTQNGAFCGYRIVIGTGDYAVVFNAISLFFNGVCNLPIYLFNDLLSPPVATKTITTVANSQTKAELNWTVNYTEANHNGGIVYIGYFDTDLPDGVQAIDEQLNLWENSIVWGGTPFTSAKISGQLNFDRRYVGTVFYSYGLNVEMSAYRDYTQVIVENVHLLDEVRILTAAIIYLSLIKNTTRSGSDNLALATKKDLIDTAISGKLPDSEAGTPFVNGLNQQLKRALQSISDCFKPKMEVKSFAVGGGMGGNSIYDQYQGFDINNMPARQTLT